MNGGYDTMRVLTDNNDFVEKLNYMYDHPEVRKSYGETARNKVMKYYSTQVVLPQWTKLFGEIFAE